MKLHKRWTFDREDYYWQVNTSDFYLSADKKSLYYFVPYTNDEDMDFDVELEEERDIFGSMWLIHTLDKQLIKEIAKIL